MDSTGIPLAKSSKKPPKQNTSSIKDKEVVEKVTEVPIRRNESTMGPNEAIISAAKSPALQRALDILRTAGTKAQHKETKEKRQNRNASSKSIGIIKNKGIVISSPEDHEIIPTVKYFEIDIKGKAKVLEENP